MASSSRRGRAGSFWTPTSRALGEDYGELPGGRGTRERIKVVSRRAMTDISRGAQVDPKATDLIGDMGEMGVPSAPERFDDYTGPGRRN